MAQYRPPRQPEPPTKRGIRIKPGKTKARNPGRSLDLEWIEAADAPTHAARRCDRYSNGPRLSSDERTEWQLRAVSLLDLTSLSLDDTSDDIDRLCRRALAPVRPDLLERLGRPDPGLTVAGVCVYPAFVRLAKERLEGSPVRIATVAGAFPTGVAPIGERVGEVSEAARLGSDEIDAVIRRDHVLNGAWEALYDEIRTFREASGDSHLKIILGTGELETLTNVHKASLVAMMAGADFVKTSTGKEDVNATLPAGLTMCEAIRDYYRRTGIQVGLKPAGGIRTTEQALSWLMLVDEELGEDWLTPTLFRFGASSLLTDLEGRLEDGTPRTSSAPSNT